jgi:formylglycine-generating enzyme required for sulfatase activity
MVAVAPGRVTLSDRRTQTTWTVDLDAYEIGSVPVTQGLYEDVVGARPSSHADPDHPVEGVTWWDAVTFCNLLSAREGLEPAYAVDRSADHAGRRPGADGYRVPTEAEWEHACRAGTSGPRYADLDDAAWYAANSGDRPRPVGLKQPNAWGLHDMLGNVWEWCWDLYDPEVYGSYRVLRGGGWADAHWSCRASVRRRSHPTLAIDDVGFRLARTRRPEA